MLRQLCVANSASYAHVLASLRCKTGVENPRINPARAAWRPGRGSGTPERMDGELKAAGPAPISILRGRGPRRWSLSDLLPRNTVSSNSKLNT